MSKGVAAEVESEAISAITQIAIAAVAASIKCEVRGDTANNSTAEKCDQADTGPAN